MLPMSVWDDETWEQRAVRTTVELTGTTQTLRKLETVLAHFHTFQKSLLFTATNNKLWLLAGPNGKQALKWIAFLMLMHSLAFFFFF